MRQWLCGALMLAAGSAAVAADPDQIKPSRGELLYTTYCVACHTEQVHWRDKTLVTGWPSLRSEVRRWQGIGALDWSSDDVEEVARHLNRLHYHYPLPDR